jgi:hypothetical protein
MSYRLAADGLLIVHLLFILFVLFGAFLVVRRPTLLWFHVAAVLWGALIEFSGALCPLTPLEVRLRQLGGEAGYSGDFIDHYIVRLLYPSELTRSLQVGLGSLVLMLNVSAYTYFLWRRRRLSWRSRP